MTKQPGAERFMPSRGSLRALHTSAADCQGCDLYANATQTVFGEGAATARVMLLGEQPGDREDRAGRPFVGPAGQLLDRVLADAGLGDTATYLTNAVKHFRFTPPERGKRRIHKAPSRSQLLACQPWLLAELRAVTPDLVVCLGLLPRSRCSDRTFGSPHTAANCSTHQRPSARPPATRGDCSRPCIPRRCCAPKTGIRHTRICSRICGSPPAA